MGVTNQEINNALLRRRGYTQYRGNKDNLSPLMYFFLMDASQQIFAKDVTKQTCSGMQAKLMGRMCDGYHLFFKNFFAAFNDNRVGNMLIKSVEFHIRHQHHVDIAEIAMQECDNGRPIEEQREVSRMWLCNLLAASAQDFHGECWRTGRNHPLFDRYIDQVLKASKEYARLRFGEGPDLTEKQFNRVQLAVRIIAKKTCQWLYHDYLDQQKTK